MLSYLKIGATVTALALAGSAQAAVIDFTTATNDGTTLVATGATATAGAGTTLAVGDFVANALCPLGGFGCNGIMTLTFDADVSNVTFDYGFGNPGDSASLSIFDGLGALISSVLLTSTSGVAFADLSYLGALRSILFDNSASTGAGYAYGNVTYTPAAVPLPASLPLLLAALGGAALIRRRKTA
ncbi:MAG: VPLPA-CTERM sorting domain-containing protein [Paracoccaceae bacterium]